MTLDIALFCIECERFLGWSSVQTDIQCSNCRSRQKRMEKLPEHYAKLASAKVGIKLRGAKN